MKHVMWCAKSWQQQAGNLFREAIILQQDVIIEHSLLPAAVTRIHVDVVAKDLFNPLVSTDIVRYGVGWLVETIREEEAEETFVQKWHFVYLFPMVIWLKEVFLGRDLKRVFS